MRQAGPMGAGRPGGPMSGPMGGMMPSVEKSKNFKGSIRRFAVRMHPERWVVSAVLVLGSVSVFLVVLDPKLLGSATNVIFAGLVSARIPAGTTVEEAEASLRAAGQDRQADMLGAMTLHPGSGVDFGELARILAVVAMVYL